MVCGWLNQIRDALNDDNGSCRLACIISFISSSGSQ